MKFSIIAGRILFNIKFCFIYCSNKTFCFRLLSYSYEEGLHIDSYRLPVACSCHVKPPQYGYYHNAPQHPHSIPTLPTPVPYIPHETPPPYLHGQILDTENLFSSKMTMLFTYLKCFTNIQCYLGLASKISLNSHVLVLLN